MNQAEAGDIILGATYGALAVPVIGWWSLITIPACSYLWWKSGRVGSSWRVYGCSTATYLPMLLIKLDWMVAIPWVASALLLSVGYGIPDLTDTGSTLGRFFYQLFDKDEKMANLFTRGTIYAGLLACFVVAWVI